jgi:hypothetical protein
LQTNLLTTTSSFLLSSPTVSHVSSHISGDVTNDYVALRFAECYTAAQWQLLLERMHAAAADVYSATVSSGEQQQLSIFELSKQLDVHEYSAKALYCVVHGFRWSACGVNSLLSHAQLVRIS